MELEEIKQRHRQAVDNLATMPMVPYEAGEVVRRFVNLDCLELISEVEQLRSALGKCHDYFNGLRRDELPGIIVECKRALGR